MAGWMFKPNRDLAGFVDGTEDPSLLALQALSRADEIVVYCSDETCIASKAFGQLLERGGYSHVLHFAGGL
jgi:deferrochelatase/peroxidase EfeB